MADDSFDAGKVKDVEMVSEGEASPSPSKKVKKAKENTTPSKKEKKTKLKASLFENLL